MQSCPGKSRRNAREFQRGFQKRLFQRSAVRRIVGRFPILVRKPEARQQFLVVVECRRQDCAGCRAGRACPARGSSARAAPARALVWRRSAAAGADGRRCTADGVDPQGVRPCPGDPRSGVGTDDHSVDHHLDLVLPPPVDLGRVVDGEGLAIDDPAEYAAAALYEALARRGVAISGRPRARHRFANEAGDRKRGTSAPESPEVVELARRIRRDLPHYAALHPGIHASAGIVLASTIVGRCAVCFAFSNASSRAFRS